MARLKQYVASKTAAGNVPAAQSTEESEMQVTMLRTMCGPEGNAYRGTVLDVDAETAKKMIKDGEARQYDSERDRKNQRGLVRADK